MKNFEDNAEVIVNVTGELKKTVSTKPVNPVSDSRDCEHNRTASGDVRVRSVSKRTGNPHHDEFHSEF